MWPWVVTTLVLLLVLAVAGLAWAQSRDTDSYTLKVEGSGEFAVQHTTRDSLFAEAQTEDIQHACLNPDGKLRVIAKDSTPGDCHVFNVRDLPKDQREVETVTGSYDDVLANSTSWQIRRCRAAWTVRRPTTTRAGRSDEQTALPQP